MVKWKWIRTYRIANIPPHVIRTKRFIFKGRYYFKYVTDWDFKKYIYLISIDYKKKKGHKLHLEIRVESPVKMTNSEIWDYISEHETEFPIVGNLEIKGVEIEEVDYEPKTTHEILSWKH